MTPVEPKVPRGLFFLFFMAEASILATKHELGVHHFNSLHNIWSFIGQLPRPFGRLNQRPICLGPSSHFISPPPLSLIFVILLIMQRFLAAFVITPFLSNMSTPFTKSFPFQYEHTVHKEAAMPHQRVI